MASCRRWCLVVATCLLGLDAVAQTAPTQRQELFVSLLVASADQREIFEELGYRFEAQQPDVKVRWIARGDADYKKMLIPWLQNQTGPDVLYWQAGTRLRQIAEAGYLAPMDELWAAEGFNEVYPASTREKVTHNDRIYALPFSYYQWGFYYRESVFQKLGLKVPTTWEGLLRFCSDARKHDVVPIVIGSQNTWPVAAWFDYLNLRLNGLAFHYRVVSGRVPFDHPQVRRVFEHWKALLDADCFMAYDQQRDLDWQQTLPFLYRELAATTLTGNFVAPQLAPALKDDFRFFPFPQIDPTIGQFEEAPTDVFMLPLRSADNAVAKAFIAFMGRAEQQSLLSSGIGNIPTHPDADISDDYFIREGARLLQEADGLSEYFDRDARKELAGPALTEFRRFMSHRDIDRTMRHLENVRQRHFAPEDETPIGDHPQ